MLLLLIFRADHFISVLTVKSLEISIFLLAKTYHALQTLPLMNALAEIKYSDCRVIIVDCHTSHYMDRSEYEAQTAIFPMCLD